MSRERVKVVVPIYSKSLPERERKSLQQTVKMLGRYPIILLAPEGLDISAITTEFPMCEVMRVTDEWLGSKNGIAGYNTMCLSREFYEMFADCDYITLGESVSEDIFTRGLCLPSDIHMTVEEQNAVIEIIKSCFE